MSYNKKEHPVILQVGGGCPNDLRLAVELANPYEYHQINLNVGCPSDRVQRGKIGAMLMADPKLVANCFKSMQSASDSKITVKNRLSIDDTPEENIFQFIEEVASAGCRTFIIHARKAFFRRIRS